METHDTNDKYRILTTLPKSWSAYKIMKGFDVSQYVAERAKTLQEEKGVMSTPEKPLGRTSIAEEALFLVRFFSLVMK